MDNTTLVSVVATQKEWCLLCQRKFITVTSSSGSFTKAYRWMAEQMQEKISLPPKNLSGAGMPKISMLHLIIDIIRIKLVSN